MQENKVKEELQENSTVVLVPEAESHTSIISQPKLNATLELQTNEIITDIGIQGRILSICCILVLMHSMQFSVKFEMSPFFSPPFCFLGSDASLSRQQDKNLLTAPLQSVPPAAGLNEVELSKNEDLTKDKAEADEVKPVSLSDNNKMEVMNIHDEEAQIEGIKLPGWRKTSIKVSLN